MTSDAISLQLVLFYFYVLTSAGVANQPLGNKESDIAKSMRIVVTGSSRIASSFGGTFGANGIEENKHLEKEKKIMKRPSQIVSTAATVNFSQNVTFNRAMPLGMIALVLILATPSWASVKGKTLYTFLGDTGSFAWSLVRDQTGNLFGSTLYGKRGTCTDGEGCGTIFELTPSSRGSWSLTEVHVFSADQGGYVPDGVLIIDANGNLYGTTAVGGGESQGLGTVFQIAPQLGGGWKYTVLHTFRGYPNDGGSPTGITLDQAGNLYGTTAVGGSADLGTVFKLTKSNQGWSERIVHSFSGSDGASPQASLITDSQGNLYGTTFSGGTAGFGTVFEVAHNGSERVLHNFLGGADGQNPRNALVIDSAGNLYGSTESGGDLGEGSVFELDTAGKQTALYSFSGAPDGQAPGRLIIDPVGNIYGITPVGGASGVGTLFMLDLARNETVLFNFAAGGGGEAPSDVFQDSDGTFYGTTSGNNIISRFGTVFEIKP